MSPSDTSWRLPEASLELDNLRAALRWILDRRDTERALSLGAALRWYWFRHGWLSEGYRWYAEILELADAHPDSEEFGHVLAATALLAGRQASVGVGQEAEHLQIRVLALWRRLGNRLEIARSLSQLGYLYRNTGRAEALGYFEEGVRLSQEAGLRQMEALNRVGLAETLFGEERYEEALEHAHRALELQQVLPLGPGRSWAKRAIGLIHHRLGARSLARRFLEESLDDARTVDGRGWWLADAMACTAELEIESQHFERAGALLREALELSVALGDQRMIARCLERLANLAGAQGRCKRAVRLAAAADAVREVTGLARCKTETVTLARWLGAAERAIEPVALQQIRREGASMPLDSVLTYALNPERSRGHGTPVDTEEREAS
jgi:tetratricopeptide (TPR) repeat protein